LADSNIKPPDLSFVVPAANENRWSDLLVTLISTEPDQIARLLQIECDSVRREVVVPGLAGRRSERATQGQKRAYADGLRHFYRSQLRGMRRQNHRAKLGRYTPSGLRNSAVTPADLASAGPSRPHPQVAS
jgi:hypothetical protein